MEGGSGWVSISELSASSASEIVSRGALKAVAFRGGIERFIVDGKAIETNEFVQYSIARGELWASLEGAGKIHIIGNAKSVFKDKTRLNSTRWELLGWEMKSMILVSTTPVLIAFFGFVGRSLRKDDAIRFAKKGTEGLNFRQPRPRYRP